VVVVSVLIIEDDPDLRQVLVLLLGQDGYRVVEAASGEDGIRQFGEGAIDLVVLDLKLPGMSGYDVCRAIRATSTAPIVVVTAQVDSHDTVLALELGADDYVTKPFVPRVLTARIRALLRRAQTVAGTPPNQVLGHLEIARAEGEVRRAGIPVDLTRTEFRLLCELSDHLGQVLSRDTLLERVWGYDYPGDGRLVDSHIRRLRTKIELDPSEPTIVLTVRGLGYKVLRPPPGP
jgi:DNA-binding response OmpR family regulator